MVPCKNDPSEKEVLKEDFDILLLWLNPDREKAGHKYEQVRRCLTDFFVRRGMRDALSLTDEVINRVTLKVRSLRLNYVGEPTKYFLGVARNIALEVQRQPLHFEFSDDFFLTPYDQSVDYKELLFQKLEHCLVKLPQHDQEMLLRYYGENPKAILTNDREIMALEMGLTLNRLRVTVYRLKEKLKRCIENQLK
ncbi:MAG: hypothetical protein WBV94_12625 [Blastocatellia bacterium]